MKTKCWLLSHFKNRIETRANLHVGKVKGSTGLHACVMAV